MLVPLLVVMSLANCQIGPDRAKLELEALAKDSFFDKTAKFNLDFQQDGCTYGGIAWLDPPIPDTEILMKIEPDGTKKIYAGIKGWIEKGKVK
jgi:hypothetical protein